jgi:hypothetical protein
LPSEARRDSCSDASQHVRAIAAKANGAAASACTQSATMQQPHGGYAAHPGRVIMHVDLDCFYCESGRLPQAWGRQRAR